MLLHGFCENLSVWEGMIHLLQEQMPLQRLIALDLLGHTPEEEPPNGVSWTMQDIAAHVIRVLEHCGVASAVIVGHSLGGYVAMQLAKHHPERLSGLCLFQSMPFADAEETKQNRNRQIAILHEGKKSAVVDGLCDRIFATSSKFSMPEAVEFARSLMMQTPTNGMIATLAAMRDREDTSAVLGTLECPVMFLLGAEDVIVHMPRMFELLTNPVGTIQPRFVSILPNTAHMGMIESPLASVEALKYLAATVTARS